MNATPLTDPDWPLIRALQGGDENALTELIQKFEQPLFRFVFRYVGSEETARDLVQETFVRLYFHAGKFKRQAKFSTWLYTIATNLCRDYSRSKQYRRLRATVSFNELGQDESRTVDTSEDPAEALVTAERVATLQAAISELPHKLKTALILFYLEDRSQAESAKLLGVSPKTIETRVYRARKILEQKLATSEG